MPDSISFTLNGEPVDLAVDGSRRLLWVLRTDLGLTGTKYGCGEAHCGACSVLVDGRAVRSCMYSVKDLEGKEVTTIEGLAKEGPLHPLQESFVKHDALQCGFCTPGMIINAYSLLTKNPKASREEIVQGMNRNLCRCGAHTRVIDAIQEAGQNMTRS